MHTAYRMLENPHYSILYTHILEKGKSYIFEKSTSMKLRERWLPSLQIPECLHRILENLWVILYFKKPLIVDSICLRIHEFRSISRKVYVSGFIWIEYIQVWILPLEKSNNLVSISLTIHKFWIPYPWKSTSVDSLFF